jgi:DnaJ-class molecular chaperone
MITKENAMRVLDLTETTFTMKELKQQYRMYALMYHPDFKKLKTHMISCVPIVF